MTEALRYKLFGIGKMPATLQEAATGQEVLLAAEGISVKETVRQLRMPRARLSQGTRTMVGSVVLRPGQLLASLGDKVILDTDFSPPDRQDGALAIADDGLRITFDVARVLAGGSGSVELHYRLRLDAATIAQLPRASCPVALSEVQAAALRPWQGTWGS